jgi:putative tryptophan/tyrosine transport system substrate-binding protein
MRTNVMSLTLCALLLALSVSAPAQPKKIPRIGYLSAASGSSQAPQIEALRQGLRELGYVEGKNIFIEYRHADDKHNRLPSLAKELVSLKVDVIVTAGPTATRSAKDATATIPIVMGFDSDPVGSGFVAGLAHPGGNVTGLSSFSAELNGKRLELLREIVPRLARVAVLGTSTNPGNAQSLKDTEIAAKAFGVKLQFIDIRDTKDIEAAFRAASKERADGAIVLNSSFISSGRKQVTDLAARNRLPAIYFGPRIPETGEYI